MKNNTLFFKDADTGLIEEIVCENTEGNGSTSRNVSGEEHQEEMIRDAEEKGYEVIKTTTIRATKEQHDGIKIMDTEFDKKFISIANPHSFSIIGILVNYKHIVEKKSLKEVAREMGKCLTWINNIREDCFAESRISTRSPKVFKAMWMDCYNDIRIEFINHHFDKYIQKR